MNIVYCTLHVGDGYGAGRSAFEEIRYLARQGNEVHVVTRAGAQGYLAAVPGVTWTIIPDPHVSFFGMLQFVLRLRCIKELCMHCDLLYINDKEFAFIPFLKQCRSVVTYFRTSARGIVRSFRGQRLPLHLGKRLGYMLLTLMERRLIRYSALVLCKSEMMRKELQELYQIPSEIISVIPGGLAYEHIPASRTKTYSIAFLGRIVEYKGLHLLLDALAQMPSPPTLYVFGAFAEFTEARNRRYRRILQRCIASHALPVQFMGAVEPAQVQEVLRNCHTLIVPSLYEPFGLVTLEGIAAGCHVLVSEHAGVTSYVAEHSQVTLITPEDTKAFAHAIQETLLKPSVEFPGNIPEDLFWEALAKRTCKVLQRYKSKSL